MSLPHETMLDLMALADGELEGEAREQAERLVAQSDEARRIVEAMRSPAIGRLLDEAMNERASAADGVADAVMAKLQGAAGEGGVVKLADARARARRGTPRMQLVAGALTALAVAAGIALYVRSGQEGADQRSPVASVGMSTVDVQAPPSVLAQRPAQDVEVDLVESPHGITVFSIPLGGAAAAAAYPANPSSVVIMIEDDPGPQ